MLRAIRWSDNDRHYGPFTWSYSKTYRHWAVILKSRGDDDGQSGICSLRINLGNTTLIMALPGIIQPWKEKVYPQWDAETVKRLGRDWYWNLDPRQYGFSMNDGFLSIYYGRTGGPSMDSSIQQQWSYFLPWTQWRHVRHSLYGLAGEHFWTEHDSRTKLGTAGWDDYWAAKESCPKVKFTFEDHDGEHLTATTMIEEREWHFGTGWFKWLSWFYCPKISRTLDLGFSGETGPEKDSWKGGTIGTSIEMLPDELHEAAFRRYCEEDHRSKYRGYRIKFLSRILED